MKKIQQISAGILLICASAMGQDAVLVKDINTSALGVPSNPASMVKMNPGTGEILIISVEDSLSGAEIWRSDGTAAGTVLVKDAVPGVAGAEPVNLTSTGNRVFFSASNGATPAKRNLWVTNGQTGGTVLVKNLNFLGSEGPEQLFNFNGALYFEGYSNAAGREFWRSDGTDAGTVLVADIRLGASSSAIQSFFNNGTNFLFTATDGENDIGLYLSNGLNAQRLGVSQPLFNVTGNRIRPYFTRMGGFTYFSAFGADGVELWRTNGTLSGTQQVADIFPGSTSSSEPGHIVTMSVTGAQAGTYLYFAAADSATNGRELWRSNGSQSDEPTFVAPVLMKNIAAADGVSSNPEQLTVVGSLIFFRADEGSGSKLFVTNGRTGAENTRVVTSATNNADNLFNYNSTTLLFTSDVSGSVGLYTCASGTALPSTVTLLKSVGPLDSKVSDMTQIGSKVFFLVNDRELWESDLTVAGTKVVKNFRAGNQGSNAGGFAAAGAEVYFAADNGVNGRELWKSDGTPAGTEMLGDVFTGQDVSSLPNSSNPESITPVGSKVFFTAENTLNNRELWVYDPSAEPTIQLPKEINPSASSEPSNLIAYQDWVLFTATDGLGAGTTGRELWRSDGSGDGTVRVADLRTGVASSDPRSLTLFKDQIYFFANRDGVGRELMRTDGTTVTTVRDIASGAADGISTAFESMAVLGAGTAAKLYFSARVDGLTGGGQELWVSDGSEAGTVRVKDINPGAAGSNPRFITAAGSFVYFSATNGTNGIELWRSNGTDSGTLMVRDIAANGSASSSPEDLTSSNGRIFFTADDGTNGRQLWVSLGAAVSTVRLTGPGAAAGSSALTGLQDLRDIGGALVFSADDGVNGRELWISDGTVVGTRMINDISGLRASSAPGEFTEFLGQLLYTASDSVIGSEPRIAFIGADIRVEQPVNSELANNGAPVNFGVADVATKQSIQLEFTIRNAGLNTLRDIKPVLGGINVSEFTLIAPKKKLLTQGESDTFRVRFTPKEGGPRHAQISIINSDGNDNPFVVNLVGTGVKDPTITDHPDPLMLLVGEPASFNASATSTSAVLVDADYQWRRNNGSIRGATGTGFNIPAVTLRDAGAYSVAVKVGRINAFSNPAQLGVVQPNTPPLLLVAGKGRAATMRVSAAGNGLTYQWFRGATALVNTADGRVRGAQAMTLAISNLDSPDSGLYSCEVTGAGGTQTGGQTELKVFTEKPELSDPQNMPDGIVGGSYGFPDNGFQIDVDPAASKAPTSYSATNLPPGLRLNNKTGLITGRPTRSGERTVVLGAANTQRSDTVSETIDIAPFPENLAGVYMATVDRDPALNDSLGGRLDLTISPTGALSGSLLLGVERLAIRGGIEVSVSSAIKPNYTTTLKRRGGRPDVTLTFEIDTTLRVLEGKANSLNVNVRGWRQAIGTETVPFEGYYTLGLRLGNHIGQEHIPQGWSYAALTVAKGGRTRMAGRSADGETLTSAAAVGFAGQVVVFQTLYKPFAGSFLGSLILDPVDPSDATDNTLSGDVDWVRPAATNTRTRAYQAGFGLAGTPETSAVPLEAVGAIYEDPTRAGVLILGLSAPGTSNLRLDFEHAELGTQDPDQILGIQDRNRIANPNPAGLTNTIIKKLVPKTGLFDGTFRLSDPDLRPAFSGNVTRDGVFHGILIRDDIEMKSYGVGHFLLEKRARDAEVPKRTTPVLGGWMELLTNP